MLENICKKFLLPLFMLSLLLSMALEQNLLFFFGISCCNMFSIIYTRVVSAYFDVSGCFFLWSFLMIF